MDSTRPANSKTRPAKRRAAQIGPFYLWQRAQRDGEWCICWYDSDARRTRRIGTGVRGGEESHPPRAAQEALAKHFAAHSAPEPERLNPADARVVPILTRWLQGPASETARAEAYGYAVTHLTEFFENERQAGRLQRAVTIADIREELLMRYIKAKIAAGRSPETIRGDLAALRAALRWAHRKEFIDSCPFVIDVPEAMRRGPRQETFAIEEVARILETARATPERQHVFHFTMGVLAGFGRVEAVLDADLDLQLDRSSWNLTWLTPGDRQTSKRRSIMRVPPIWRPWLDEMSGKLVIYRAPRKPDKNGEPQEPYVRDTKSIRTAWKKLLADAGVPYRSPNTLRHTIISEMHALGVPEAQIDLASGHAGEGTNKRNYRHLRPEYLRDLTDGIESYFLRMDKHTQAHLRYQRDTKIVRMVSGEK